MMGYIGFLKLIKMGLLPCVQYQLISEFINMPFFFFFFLSCQNKNYK